MKRRFTKLPIASIAVVLGSLVIGLSLSPVGAQSQLTNGQVTVRSDGAVYLISNNQRRWVATVQITDEEINAYPEAEPIYAGLVPFGSASAGTASTGSTATKSGTTATKTGATGTTIATKTGIPAATKTGTTAATKTGSRSEPEETATAKDPNDPTLAEATADPNARVEPTNKTTCPASHQIKGGFDKFYWDTDRPDYASIEPEACFVSGADARAAGYTEVKKRGTTSSSTPSR